MQSLPPQGTLDASPGAVLVSWGALQRFSGSLTVKSAEAQRRLYYQEGRIIGSASSRSQETALGLLAAAGAISSEQYRQLATDARQAKRTMEEVASSRGMVQGGALREASSRAARSVIRAISSLADGEYVFSNGQRPPAGPPLVEIDPLPDMAFSLMHGLSNDRARAWLSSLETSFAIRPAAYDKVAHFLNDQGEALPASPPDSPLTTAGWLQMPSWEPRKVMAVVLLGAAHPDAADQPVQHRASPPPPSQASSQLDEQSYVPAADPDHEQKRQEIFAEHDRIHGKNHFEVLGLSEDCDSETVRTTYFEVAQKWHSDRFSGIDLGPAQQALDEIFSRINEAHDILSDSKRREGYLFYLERVRQGLPTDPQVILQAEEIFRRAQMMFDQGKMASALPLLEEAVSLNHGEAEFWIYLGYSKYVAKGDSVYQEAMADIAKGMEMQTSLTPQGKLFQGQIERLRDNLTAAERLVDDGLRSQPSNKGLQREMRLIRMRQQKLSTAHEKKKSGLFDKLLGKK